MIPFGFEYYRPETTEEAVDAHATLQREEKHPYYYAGGTEILTMARLLQIEPKAVVDIKGIPDLRALERRQGRLYLGAALTLAEICEANPWPLLSQAAGRIADHSTRCKITLGGNLAGSIQYREAVLPFLLVDTRATIAGPDGVREVPLAEVFEKTLRLQPSEMLVALSVPESVVHQPGASIKRTRMDWIDYPLVTLTLMQDERDQWALAISGLCDFPFRATAMEAVLNRSGSVAERVEEALAHIPGPVVEDLHGSADYRRFMTGQTLASMMTSLRG